MRAFFFIFLSLCFLSPCRVTAMFREAGELKDTGEEGRSNDSLTTAERTSRQRMQATFNEAKLTRNTDSTSFTTHDPLPDHEVLDKGDDADPLLTAILASLNLEEKEHITKEKEERRNSSLKDLPIKTLLECLKEVTPSEMNILRALSAMIAETKEKEKTLEETNARLISLAHSKSLIEKASLWNEILQKAREMEGEWEEITVISEKAYDLIPASLPLQRLFEVSIYWNAYWNDQIAQIQMCQEQNIFLIADTVRSQYDDQSFFEPIVQFLFNKQLEASERAIRTSQRVHDLAPSALQGQKKEDLLVAEKISKILRMLPSSSKHETALRQEDQKGDMGLKRGFLYQKTPSQASKMKMLQEKIGYHFQSPQLLNEALTHSSHTEGAMQGKKFNNERLEFFGDAVLNLIITKNLFERFPDFQEGILTSMRARLVAAPTLHACATALDLQEYLNMSRGERISMTSKRSAILGDAFEALIGAIYRDGGMGAAETFVETVMQPHLQDITTEPEEINPIGKLQNIFQAKGWSLPEYQCLKEEGPDHLKSFRFSVSYEGRILGIGEGTTKKEAKAAAASKTLKRFSD